MASVNQAVKSPAPRTHEGTIAKRTSLGEQLRRTVMACLLWEDDFYEDGKSIADRITDLAARVEPNEVAELAIEARENMKLRHVPLWLARILASRADLKGRRGGLARLLERIIQRPDELTEFVALYWKDGRQPLAAPVKRGLARAFRKFSPYQLAKYNRDGKIKLRDVLFLTHPKPKDREQTIAWKQLAHNALPAPDTWEVALSAGKDKKSTWERLIKSEQLGALALLRNLRNMQDVGVDRQVIRQALATMDVSRVLPFRFVAAARYAPDLEPDIEAAMFRATDGLPKLTGRTALVIDTSPSMWMDKVSTKSDMTRFDAAAALAILARELCEDVSVYAFNDRVYAIPARRGYALRDALEKTKAGWSRGGLAVEMANANGYDRIIVITDGQWHTMRTQSEYDYPAGSTAVSPRPLTDAAYMVNVSSTRFGVGYGQWTQIDGWSEAVLDYIAAIERSAL